jgi:cobaltochelatase CobT
MDAKQARAILRNVFTGAAIRPQDMLRSCKGILGSLPLVANALVQASGKRVNVVHRGGGLLGATDGNTIALMDLPIPKDDSDIDTFVLMLALAYGLIHHEVGHVNHSSFDTVGRAQATGSELVMHLRGIIEDVRQENVHIRRFSAAKPYLDALNAALQITGHFSPVTSQAPPIQAFTGYLLYRLYRDYRGDATVNDLVEPAEQVIKQMFPADVLIRLETLLPRMRQLEDSDDALELAIDIESMLKDEIEKAKQQQQGQSQQQGNGPQQPGNAADSSGGAPGQQDASNPPSGAPGQNQSAKGKGKKQSDTKDAVGNATSGSGAGGSTPDLQQLIDNVQLILDGTKAKDAYGDKGHSIAQALQQLVQQIQKDGVQGQVEMTNEALQRDLDDVSDNAPRRNSPYDMAQALSVTGQLRVKLIRELQAQTELDIRVGKRGRRISSRHLHRIVANDPRVFRTVDEEQDLDTAVALMIDVSGSMADEVDPQVGTRVIEVASKALYATAVAMESLDGVDVAVGTFPYFDVVKPFSTRARRIDGCFSLDAAGGTPMAQGVQLGVRLLQSSDKHRKILIVITDGAPNSRAEAQLAILAAEREGIEVFGLGICTTAGEDIFDRWDVIREVTELPVKLMDLLRSKMLRAA